MGNVPTGRAGHRARRHGWHPACALSPGKSQKSLPKGGSAAQSPLHIPGLILPEVGAGGCRTAPGSGGRFSRGRGAKSTAQGEFNDGELKRTQGLPASLSGRWGHRRRFWSRVRGAGRGMQGTGCGMWAVLSALQQPPAHGAGEHPGATCPPPHVPRQDLAHAAPRTDTHQAPGSHCLLRGGGHLPTPPALQPGGGTAPGPSAPWGSPRTHSLPEAPSSGVTAPQHPAGRPGGLAQGHGGSRGGEGPGRGGTANPDPQ